MFADGILRRLREGRLVVVLSCSDFHAHGGHKKQSDLVYLDRPERVRDRLVGICRLLLTDAYASFIEPGAASAARANEQSPEALLEHFAGIAKGLSARCAKREELKRRKEPSRKATLSP